MEQRGEAGERVPPVPHRGPVEQRVLELQEHAHLLAGVAQDPAELVGPEPVPHAELARAQPLGDQFLDHRRPAVRVQHVTHHGAPSGFTMIAIPPHKFNCF